MLNNRKADSSSTKWRVSVEVRTKSSFTVIEMEAVKFVESNIFLPDLHKLLSLAQVVSSSPCMRRVETESDWKMLQVSLVKFTKILDEIAKFTTLSSRDFKKKFWRIPMFLNFFQNILNIMRHILICIGNIVMSFTFTNVHIYRFKSGMMTYFKIMNNTLNVGLTLVKGL